MTDLPQDPAKLGALSIDELKLIAAVRAGSTHDASYMVSRILCKTGGETWTYNRSAALYILGVLALEGGVLSDALLDSGNGGEFERVIDVIAETINHILREYSGEEDDLAQTVSFAGAGRSAVLKRQGGAE